MYAQNAKEAQVEEVILHRDNIVTEGATSNVFMIKAKLYIKLSPAVAAILNFISEQKT
jgi:branched-subunit amino acid aminotransferase/4-amino-4-deoxychorismate lyase